MTGFEPSPSPASPKRILVIEDEAPSRRLITTALRSMGHEVNAVASAEGAATVLKEAVPDLLVVDLRLPGADGLTFASQLQTNSSTRDIPILLISAYDRPRLATAARFLAKPFELSNLERVVDEMLT